MKTRWVPLAAGLVAALAGCKTVVKNDVLQDSVRAKFRENHWPEPTVSCGGEAHKDGDRFTCPIALADGQRGAIEVEIHQNDVSWKVRDWVSMTMLTRKLAAEMNAKMGAETSIVCPYADVALYPNGSHFTCTATPAGGVARTVEVTLVDGESLTYTVVVQGDAQPSTVRDGG